MPRHFRKISSTNIYHVMLRGINKNIIFNDNQDKNKMLKTIKKVKQQYECKIYSYCLMNNHIHLLIDDCGKKISSIIQSLAITYAIYFNKKYERVGHLFQNRYNSKCVENQSYLLNVIRYIHRNPEKANICLTQDYKWSSYKEYMNESEIVDCDYILNIFDQNLFISRQKFKEFNLSSSIRENYKDELEYEFINKFSDEEATKIIKEELKLNDICEISNYNIKIRNYYIRKIKMLDGISKNQISRILNLNRKIIERA